MYVRKDEKRIKEIGDKRDEFLKGHIKEHDKVLRGVLDEHSFTEEPLPDSDTRIFNEIKRTSTKTIPLAYCEGENMLAFVLERVLGYYVLHVRLKGELVVRKEKIGIYDYLSELKEKQENDRIGYDLKAVEAFERFDHIYDTLESFNLTKDEIKNEVRLERRAGIYG